MNTNVPMRSTFRRMQILVDFLGKRFILQQSLLFVAVSLSLGLSGCNSATSESAPASTVTTSGSVVAVRTARVTSEDVVPELALVGTFTSIRRSVIGSPVDGRVNKIYVETGDLVTSISTEYSRSPTKPIVQLSTETVDTEIAAAKAELARLQHELEELKTGNRPEEITRSKALWEAARLTSVNADARFQRTDKLNLRNAITEEELENLKLVALRAKQTMIAAKADYDLMEAGPRSEEVARAVSQFEKQNQEISRLNILRSYHTIFAPFTGYVVQKHTEAGQWLSRGDPVAEIVSLDPIDVLVHVPESIINELQTGDTVPLRVTALPEGMETLEGKIHGIGPSADQRARTFPVFIRLKNPERDGRYLLRDGMQARATIYGKPRQSLLVSKDALVLGGHTPVVMIATPREDGQTVAVQVEVEIGISRKSMIEVRGDLKAGQQVIIDGNERIQSGQQLRVIDDFSKTEDGQGKFANTKR